MLSALAVLAMDHRIVHHFLLMGLSSALGAAFALISLTSAAKAASMPSPVFALVSRNAQLFQPSARRLPSAALTWRLDPQSDLLPINTTGGMCSSCMADSCS